MLDNTRQPLSTTAPWLDSLVNVVLTLRQQGESISVDSLLSALATQMGGAPALAGAWLLACEVMTAYATAPLNEQEDALFEEGAAIAASRRAFRPLFEARLQARSNAVDAATRGKTTCPICGQKASSIGRTSRSWESTLGEIRLSRRWCECEDPEHTRGRSLAQERLLLPAGPYTAPLEEALTLLATTVPHGLATQLASRLLCVEVSEHAVQDSVERRGRGVTELQDREAAELRPFEDNGLERKVSRPAEAVPAAPAVAYLEVDGVLPMTRVVDEDRSEPVEGARGGKGRRYTLVGKEVKNAVLYTGEACAAESEGRGCILEKSYVSHLGSWARFALVLWASMVRLRFDQAKLLVILSDGAEWIRSLADWMPVPVFLILDLYHALHRVWEVGRAVYGDKTAQCDHWAREQCRRIEAGEVGQVLEGLRFLRLTTAHGREKAEELITYFENNRDRMDYPSYRARGLRVTSGTVESANYHVTGARLKLQGMRWSEEGAAQMARLRADLFNGVWQQRTRALLAA
jgi:hypothetical protein